jgi:hypothetical protein
MTLKFKPEDFEQEHHGGFGKDFVSIKEASKIASSLFDKWLSEQKIVYGTKYPDNSMGAWTYQKFEETGCNPDTHTARLVCIEPIVKCEHSAEKVSLTNYVQTDNSTRTVGHYSCSCGVRVRPKAYEVVE